MPYAPFPIQAYNPFGLGHIVGTTQNLGAIVNTNNVTPIVITITAHGYSTGNRVRIASVTGQTALNADWTIGVIDANTITIPLAGNGSVSGSGTISRICLPITFNLPALSGQNYAVNSITFEAFASNVGNIYVGNAATMLNVTPFTDCVYIMKPGTTQNMPFFSPGNSNIISIDPWGIDWDAAHLGDGVLVSVFVR